MLKRAGEHITIVTYGLVLHYCLEAASNLEGNDVSVEVIDLPTLKPLDTSTIVDSVKKTGKLLIVHEDNLTGGIGAEIAAIVAQEAFEYLDGPIMRLCGPDVPTMPFAKTLEEAYLPTTDKIVNTIQQLADY